MYARLAPVDSGAAISQSLLRRLLPSQVGWMTYLNHSQSECPVRVAKLPRAAIYAHEFNGSSFRVFFLSLSVSNEIDSMPDGKEPTPVGSVPKVELGQITDRSSINYLYLFMLWLHACKLRNGFRPPLT